MRVIRILLCIFILVLLLYFLSCFLKEAQITPSPPPGDTPPANTPPAKTPTVDTPPANAPTVDTPPAAPLTPIPEPEPLVDTFTTNNINVERGAPGIRFGFEPNEPQPEPQPNEPQPAVPSDTGVQTVVGMPMNPGGASDTLGLAGALMQLGLGGLLNWAAQNYPPQPGVAYARPTLHPALPSMHAVVHAQPVVQGVAYVKDAGINDLNANTTPRTQEYLSRLNNNLVAVMRLEPVAPGRNPDPDNLLRLFGHMIGMHFEIGRRPQEQEHLVGDVAQASLRTAVIFTPELVKQIFAGFIPRQGRPPETPPTPMNDIVPYVVTADLIEHFRQMMNDFDPDRTRTVREWAEYLYGWVVTEGWNLFRMAGRPYINKAGNPDNLPDARPNDIMDTHVFRDPFVDRLICIIIDRIRRIREALRHSCQPQTRNGRIG